MMAETTTAPCGICKGKKSEHGPGKTQHVYSPEGQLKTHKQEEAEQQRQAGPQLIRLPGAQTNEAGAIGRLCEVLMDNGLMSQEQALYVAGMGTKPEKMSGFQDPARRHPFYKDSPGAGI